MRRMPPGKALRFFLGNSPPVYIVLYLLLIPIFAKIYYNLPPVSFYHSTARYEFNNLTPEAKKIRSDFRKAIATNFVNSHNKSQESFHGWYINANYIRVPLLNVAAFPQEFTVSFNVNVPVIYLADQTQSGSIPASVPSWALTPKIKVFLQHGDCNLLNNKHYCMMKIEEGPLPKFEGVPYMPKPSVLFPHPKQYVPQGVTSGLPKSDLVYVPPSLYNRIVAFGQAYRGFPSQEVRGQRWRMLYLSAAIATSNTLGDIQPLTTPARVGVTVQALVSLILIGFFLNSAANRIASYRELPPSSQGTTPEDHEGVEADKIPQPLIAKVKKRRRLK